jgi:hypothetical protein
MRLRTPGRINDAIAEVRSQQSKCGNSFNGHGANDRLRQVIDWCNEAEMMLGNHFTS